MRVQTTARVARALAHEPARQARRTVSASAPDGALALARRIGVFARGAGRIGGRGWSPRLPRKLCQKALRIAMRDGLGDVRRKLPKPRADPGHELRIDIPPLVPGVRAADSPRVRTDHEAIAVLHEERAPLRVELSPRCDVVTQRQLGPKVRPL